MGIPKFYRYLSERYPLINEVVTSAQYLPVCDYLYLDLNGVIHNATHGNSITQGVKSEEVVAEYIMGYISHIFKQIKPRKLMFIAVDGVAPRAKLNQQRSRRFRSALDAQAERQAKNYEGASFDSNCITPGTEFMYKVDKILEYFINKKLLEDPLWKNTKVIYSSHSDPGEGEHKIMAYIRSYYTDPNHNLTERHCIYGLDADLILLSLSLHDVNVVLLREIINFFSFMNTEEIKDRAVGESHWQILHVGMLREYLLSDLVPEDHKWIQNNDIERLIDDFVCLMILLGDDFLPELPSLDINEGSIQLLVDLYKDVISNVKGFLVEDAKPVLPVLKIILSKIAGIEEELFEERAENRQARKKRKTKGGFEERKSSPPSEHPELAEPGGLPVIKSEQYMLSTLGRERFSNYRDHYYFDKLNLKLPDHQEIVEDACKCYYEGLQWVLAYYYRGVPSWSWYYPYHYAPLAFDLAAYDMIYQPFVLGKPFTPFLQQLGCLPPLSAPILPKAYQRLVLDEDSPIIQFYPTTFSIDMNDKVNPWEGVNLIPFIDEYKLRNAIREFGCDAQLTDAEKARNSFRPASLYSFDSIFGKQTVRMLFQSTLFPPFGCPVFRQDYVIPAPQGKQETVIHCSALPGSFFIPLRQRTITEDHIGIVSTGRVSKHATVILNIPNKLVNVSVQLLSTLASNSCDKVVQYPLGHHRYAYVNSLYTRTHRAFLEEDHVEIEELTNEEMESLTAVFDRMPHNALVGKNNVIGLGGMNIGDVTVLAELYPIIGSQRDPTSGEVEFRYACDSIFYPYHLLSAGGNQTGMDQRLCALPSIPLTSLVGENSPCVFIGPGEFQGKKLIGFGGFIKSIDGPRVHIQLVRSPTDVGAGHRAIADLKREKWYTIHELQGILQLSSRGILGLAGLYPLFTKEGKKPQHLGLDMVYQRRLHPRYVQYMKKAITYTEEYDNPLPYAPLAVPLAELDEKNNSFMRDLYFSKKALHLFMEYKRTFPWLFARILDTDTSHSFEALFENEKQFFTVVDWLSSHRIDKDGEPMMDYSSRCCSPNQADVLQQTGVRLNKRPEPTKVKLSCPHYCITFWEKEYLTVSPQETKKVVPVIGDRVVITGGNDIPFGSYGFVLAVHPASHMVEVVMDKPFIGGTSLHGLLKVEGRGAVIPWEHCYPLKYFWFVCYVWNFQLTSIFNL